MNNQGGCSIYIDDIADTPNITSFVADSFLGFPASYHVIGTASFALVLVKGRLSQVFLDYTYRDLSVESNRRLFITDDGKPADSATLASLNPIMYMPMSSPDTWHENSGTGGDFVANGTVATSGRGPNQDNCVASEFDGTSQYLSRSSALTGATASKVFTFSCTFNVAESTLDETVISIGDGANNFFWMKWGDNGPTQYLFMRGYNSAFSSIMSYNTPSISVPPLTTNSLQVALDMADESKSIVVLNGTKLSIDAFAVFIDDSIDFSSSLLRIGANIPLNSLFEGTLGEVYFDTAYIDLATDNPFWGSETNLPIPVKNVIENTGITPIIALPIRADDAGTNLGSGGDFTVNSGPFTGARGASEFWARSANFTPSVDWLNNSSPSISDSKVFSFVCSFKRNTMLGDGPLFTIRQGAADSDILFNVNSNGNGRIYTTAYSTAQEVLGSFTNEVIVVDTWYTVFVSVDLANSANRALIIEGVATPGQTWATYVNDTVDFSSALYSSIHLVKTGSTDASDIDIGFLYFNTAYIDFSYEANRLLFVDAFGYPTDIEQKIEDGDIADPLVLMLMKDSDDLGKNNGTGGDFTVNGTVNSGSDVDPNA